MEKRAATSEAKNEKPESRGDKDFSIQARFASYNSPFFQLIATMLTTRYLWLAVEDINPFNFLKKPDPSLKPGFVPWKKPPASEYASRNFAALGMGATLLGVLGYYTARTDHDIRALYGEAVGYELNKKPEDVTKEDIYIKSHNAALQVTRRAFLKRSLMRFGAASAFLVPWHMFRDWKIEKPKYDANANAGVGAVGTYLTLEAFFRTPSFFDAEQNLAGTAINHSVTSADPNIHKVITSENIQSLLFLQRKHLNKKDDWPSYSSAQGQNEITLADRIAKLMNQTYNNVPKTEEANFTIGKFNYLIGFNLLEDFPKSLAFVELANRSHDMAQVKSAAAGIKAGLSPVAVFKGYGIDMNALGKAETAASETSRTFADRVLQQKDRKPQALRTHAEFATQTSGSGPAL